MLHARGLTLRYPGAASDAPAVRDLSFWIEPGEIVALLGLNGAGKSSTIAMLTGLLAPTAGEVLVGGHRLRANASDARARAVRALIGYVPDRPFVYGQLTAREFVRFHGALYGKSRTEVDHVTAPLFRRFGLGGREDTVLESFSHGMRQKAILIATLAHHPRLLVLDEPIVGLDPESAREMLDLLRETADQGAAVLFSTHLLSIAADVADRVVVLRDGALAADGTLPELAAATGVAVAAPRDLEEVFFRLIGRSGPAAGGGRPLAGTPRAHEVAP